MSEKHNENQIDRRNFLKTVGVAGLSSVFASAGAVAAATDPNTTGPNVPQKALFPQVPGRILGKTGVEVSSLSLGTMFDLVENQTILRKSLQWGVSYWDTADCYAGGNSEAGIGKFFEKNPDIRRNVFIGSKSDARDDKRMTRLLDRSLERMKTDYIDLYFLHGVSDPKDLNQDVKDWVKNTKKTGKIKFFGFSTHGNIPQCLLAAANAGWVDAIMTVYNFRLMQDPQIASAVEACHKAGVGLVAMKTQAHKIQSDAGKKLVDHFLQRGFTEGQAKIKVVLEDRRFSSACVGMKSVAILTENAAAVLDKTALTGADKDFLRQYARATCTGYCAGCTDICASALPEMPYVGDIMRYLMYYNSYGEHTLARELFAGIPVQAKARLAQCDYSRLEALCPQKLPISRLMTEAVEKLA